MELQGRLKGYPVSAGNPAVQFFENYRQLGGVGRCRLDGSAYSQPALSGHPDGRKSTVGYRPVAKRNGIKLFSLIP